MCPNTSMIAVIASHTLASQRLSPYAVIRALAACGSVPFARLSCLEAGSWRRVRSCS